VVVKVLDKPELAATGMAAWTRMLGKVFLHGWAHAMGTGKPNPGKKITCASGILVGLD
jgi:hypothetical protein